MMRYIYLCERCRSTFEAEVADATEPAPFEAVCPRCEFPHAMKISLAPDTSTGCGCPPGQAG
jgi:DNA-directed RNA polymerase subunit RPC12/RpoP